MNASLLYITNYRMPTEKAHGLQVARMCDAFAEAGASLELVVPKRPFIKESVRAYYGLRHEFPVTYLPVWDLTGKIPFIGFFIQSLTFAFAALQYVRMKKYNGPIITRDQFTAFVFSLAGRNAFFYEAHTLPKRGSFFYRSIFKKATRIIVISDGLRDALVQQGVPSDKIVVERDAYEPSLFLKTGASSEIRQRLGVEEHKALIMYIGSLMRWKGVYTLLDAADMLPSTYHVVIIGGPQKDFEALEQYFHEHHIRNVSLKKQTPHSEIALYVRAADILVLPNSAVDDISRLYTSPLKLFDYLASARPIVASDVPSLHEIGDQFSGISYFKPDDAGELARVITSADYRQHYKRDMRAYTWDARASRILKLIADASA